MENIWVLVLVGLLIGTFGTLIGAGGGFILVPLLIITNPSMPPSTITAISIAIVAANAISGSIAYARAGRIDYKAGWKFAIFTIPGSIIGVYLTQFIPAGIFHIVFGLLLLGLSVLVLKQRTEEGVVLTSAPKGNFWKHHTLTDKQGLHFDYWYNQNYGIVISILVGFLSPLLGIGGGIIHVPAMVQWLRFPVSIATATSHFILAIMSIVSVIVHIWEGSYTDPTVLRMVAALAVGAVAGAQIGAYISHRIPTGTIVRVLAVCLGLVGFRLLIQTFF